MHGYLGVSTIELNGTYFCVSMNGMFKSAFRSRADACLEPKDQRCFYYSFTCACFEQYFMQKQLQSLLSSNKDQNTGSTAIACRLQERRIFVNSSQAGAPGLHRTAVVTSENVINFTISTLGQLNIKTTYLGICNLQISQGCRQRRCFGWHVLCLESRWKEVSEKFSGICPDWALRFNCAFLSEQAIVYLHARLWLGEQTHSMKKSTIDG